MTVLPPEFLSLDLPPLLAALFTSLACALVGNFLVLRRMSMLGDTVSHAVLPGIVVGFLLSGSRQTLPMLLGALGAGLLAAFVAQLLRSFARIEPGAALGVVLTVFFAFGVFLLEQTAAHGVDLDAGCVLYGQLEGILWDPPAGWAALAAPWTVAASLPREVHSAFGAFLLVLVWLVLLKKENALVTFDPGLSYALGFSPQLLHLLFLIVVTSTVVASFEIVGSILVTSMLVCPAAAARFLTDRLNTQLLLSSFLAATSAILGYLLAAFGAPALGLGFSVNAAGTMALVSGFFVFAAFLLSPHHGLLSRVIRMFTIRERIRREDILGVLLRCEERSHPCTVSTLEASLGGAFLIRISLRRLVRRALVRTEGNTLELSVRGRRLARRVVRTHRLWEIFLVRELGLRPDHVHDTAERLEHFTGQRAAKELRGAARDAAVDPHGRKIPK